MSASDEAHLFVYGTLMAAATGRLGRAQRLRLVSESRFVGEATMAGRLVDLGRYPGFVAAERDGDIVRGELVVLGDAERSLAWLDAYEGIVSGEHDHHEYVRERREASVASGERVAAWVYVYRRLFDAAKVIEGGDWVKEREN